jgi:hypothetical protein
MRWWAGWLICGEPWLNSVYLPKKRGNQVSAMIALPNRRNLSGAFWLAALLLGLFWLSRTHSLLSLPLFLDEASHLYRAQLVWEGRPFFLLETGKALAPYLAALFNPYHAAPFVGRYVVILVGAVGLASAYGVGRRLHSDTLGLAAMLLWLAAPQLFFFERMALVDTTISAMAMLALWCALVMLQTTRRAGWWAVGCGVALALTVLAKLTGLVFLPIPALAAILIAGKMGWRQRLRLVLIAYITFAALWALPLRHILTAGADPTGQRTGLTSLNTSTLISRAVRNLTEIWGAEVAYFGLAMLILIGVMAVVGLLMAPRRSLLLLALLGAPLAAIVATANDLWLRYASPAAPFMLMLCAFGLSLIGGKLAPKFGKKVAGGVIFGPALLWLLLWGLPFQVGAYQDPRALALPEGDRVEYILWIPSGYGIRDAVRYMNATALEGSVFGTAVNCQSARLMLQGNSKVSMVCPALDWGGRNYQPVIDQLEAAVKANTSIYVLSEERSPPTVPLDKFSGRRVEVARFARPGPYYAVVLYKLSQ